VWLQEISIPPPQRIIGNSKEEGVLKAKICTRKCEPKLEFSEGWGIHTKENLCGESRDIFWNNTL